MTTTVNKELFSALCQHILVHNQTILHSSYSRSEKRGALVQALYCALRQRAKKTDAIAHPMYVQKAPLYVTYLWAIQQLMRQELHPDFDYLLIMKSELTDKIH